jgi:hypothetical protein
MTIVRQLRGEKMVDPSLKAADIRFFWIEDDPVANHLYHWCVDCAWVSVAQWHGGRLISSEAPPVDAGDEAFVRELVPESFGPAAWAERTSASEEPKRWLCAVCEMYWPRAVATRHQASDERCLQCGCRRERHISCRSPFDHGCGMAWAETDYDRDGTYMGAHLIHCPCDGYAPPPGAQEVEA